MRPHGRGTVVITGASEGIGQATALRLDTAGYRVFAGVRSDTDAAMLRATASDRVSALFNPQLFTRLPHRLLSR